MLSKPAAGLIGPAVLGVSLALAVTGSAVAQQKQAPQQQPPKGQAAPAAPTGGKVEISTVDAWILNCRTAAAGTPRVCTAQARILQTNPANQQSRIVFRWTIGMENGKLAGLFDVPTGVMIAPGLDIQIGRDTKRKVAYTQCAAGGCQALTPLDEPLLKAMQSAPTLDATIVAMDERQIKFSLDLKGVDKVLVELRK